MARLSLMTGFFVGMLLVGVCVAMKVHVEIELEETVSYANPFCDTCLEFSNEARLILSDPQTQKDAVDFLSQLACQSLTERLKTKCVQLVSGYVPLIMENLEVYLGPEICTEVGVCTPETLASRLLKRTNAKIGGQPRTNNLVGSLIRRASRANLIPVGDDRTCTLCQEFAQDALAYLESDKAQIDIIAALHRACAKWDSSKQCDLLVDIYAPALIKRLDTLTPEEICETTRLCKTTTKAAVAGQPRLKANDCAICQFVVLEVKIKLEDPVIQAKLFDVLLSGCSRVQNHVDECRLIVQQYGPFILANLDSMLNADAVCSKIGACSTKSKAFEPLLALLPEGKHVKSMPF